MDEREHLKTLQIALEAASTTLRRPYCREWLGDYQINGKRGHVLSDGNSFYFYHFAHSKLAWTWAKRAFSFGILTQDGDDEGIFKLNRLPSEIEAKTIRKYLRIQRTQSARLNAADNFRRPPNVAH